MLLLNKFCRRSGLFRAAAAEHLVYYRSSPLSACLPEGDKRPGSVDRKIFPSEGSIPARADRRGPSPAISTP